MPRFSTRLFRFASLAGLALSVATPSTFAARHRDGTTGPEALKAVRHDWKKGVRSAVHTRQSSSLPIPAHFGRLSPEDRLAFLHARRDLNPANFDRFHPSLGRILALDDRLRLAQSQNCAPMNGLLPDNAHTRYLQFRRSLNPANFDRYHTSLGAILVEDQKLKTGQGCVAGIVIPPTVTPPTVTPTPSPTPAAGGVVVTPVINPVINPVIITPRAVPEPTGLVLLSLGLACTLVPAAIRRLKGRPEAAE